MHSCYHCIMRILTNEDGSNTKYKHLKRIQGTGHACSVTWKVISSSDEDNETELGSRERNVYEKRSCHLSLLQLHLTTLPCGQLPCSAWLLLSMCACLPSLGSQYGLGTIWSVCVPQMLRVSSQIQTKAFTSIM